MKMWASSILRRNPFNIINSLPIWAATHASLISSDERKIETEKHWAGKKEKFSVLARTHPFFLRQSTTSASSSFGEETEKEHFPIFVSQNNKAMKMNVSHENL